jgi:hypothetical protein
MLVVMGVDKSRLVSPETKILDCPGPLVATIAPGGLDENRRQPQGQEVPGLYDREIARDREARLSQQMPSRIDRSVRNLPAVRSAQSQRRSRSRP